MIKCDICGSIKESNRKSYKYNMNICRKHYYQLEKYGKITENSDFNFKENKNIIIILKNYAIIELKTKYGEISGYAIIDIDDVDRCKKYKWHLNSVGYATTKIQNKSAKLHKFITNTNADSIIDHINRNKLDNRKENLRIVTKRENSINKNYQSNNKANFLGIYEWNPKNSKIKYWVSKINTREEKFCKYFHTKEEAIIQRLRWELKYFKKYCPQIELIKEKYEYLLGENLNE